MKTLLFIIGLILIMTSCNKKNQPKFEYKDYSEVIKYKINISGDYITDFSKYINNEIVEITTFYNYDTIIQKISKNTQGEIIRKFTFYMGNDGFATSSIDSTNGITGLWLTKSNYNYENAYLVEMEYDYWNYLDSSIDSGNVVVQFTRENGNIINKKVMPNSWTSGIRDSFTYSNYLNKIDILDFSNGMTGNINNNLMSHVLLSQGIPLHGGSNPYRDFNYEFDNDGYVTKMIKTLTPSYNLTEPGVVTRTIHTTFYEYSFN